jgi:hypothetical protein
MWFYICAAVFVVLLAIWVSRTNLFRHFLRAPHRGQVGARRGGAAYYNVTKDLTRRRD